MSRADEKPVIILTECERDIHIEGINFLSARDEYPSFASQLESGCQSVVACFARFYAPNLDNQPKGDGAFAIVKYDFKFWLRMYSLEPEKKFWENDLPVETSDFTRVDKNLYRLKSGYDSFYFQFLNEEHGVKFLLILTRIVTERNEILERVKKGVLQKYKDRILSNMDIVFLTKYNPGFSAHPPVPLGTPKVILTECKADKEMRELVLLSNEEKRIFQTLLEPHSRCFIACLASFYASPDDSSSQSKTNGVLAVVKSNINVCLGMYSLTESRRIWQSRLPKNLDNYITCEKRFHVLKTARGVFCFTFLNDVHGLRFSEAVHEIVKYRSEKLDAVEKQIKLRLSGWSQNDFPWNEEFFDPLYSLSHENVDSLIECERNIDRTPVVALPEETKQALQSTTAQYGKILFACLTTLYNTNAQSKRKVNGILTLMKENSRVWVRVYSLDRRIKCWESDLPTKPAKYLKLERECHIFKSTRGVVFFGFAAASDGDSFYNFISQLIQERCRRADMMAQDVPGNSRIFSWEKSYSYQNFSPGTEEKKLRQNDSWSELEKTLYQPEYNSSFQSSLGYSWRSQTQWNSTHNLQSDPQEVYYLGNPRQSPPSLTSNGWPVSHKEAPQHPSTKSSMGSLKLTSRHRNMSMSTSDLYEPVNTYNSGVIYNQPRQSLSHATAGRKVSRPTVPPPPAPEPSGSNKTAVQNVLGEKPSSATQEPRKVPEVKAKISFNQDFNEELRQRLLKRRNSKEHQTTNLEHGYSVPAVNVLTEPTVETCQRQTKSEINISLTEEMKKMIVTRKQNKDPSSTVRAKPVVQPKTQALRDKVQTLPRHGQMIRREHVQRLFPQNLPKENTPAKSTEANRPAILSQSSPPSVSRPLPPVPPRLDLIKTPTIHATKPTNQSPISSFELSAQSVEKTRTAALPKSDSVQPTFRSTIASSRTAPTPPPPPPPPPVANSSPAKASVPNLGKRPSADSTGSEAVPNGVGDSRAALLDQIRRGTKLRNVQTTEKQDDLSSRSENSFKGAFSRVLASRSIVIHGSDSENDSVNHSEDEEWDC